MAKQKNKTYLVLLVILIIIVVIGYQKYGPEQVVDEEEPAEEAEAEVEAEEGAAAEEEAQPLYPDLCYAAGGTPRPTSDGCRSGEKNIGDVPGFKVPNICCAPR